MRKEDYIEFESIREKKVKLEKKSHELTVELDKLKYFINTDISLTASQLSKNEESKTTYTFALSKVTENLNSGRKKIDVLDCRFSNSELNVILRIFREKKMEELLEINNQINNLFTTK